MKRGVVETEGVSRSQIPVEQLIGDQICIN